ncbi:MAG: hypothetical protein WCT31_01640 [Candidatus Micrarchaeia archaeon]
MAGGTVYQPENANDVQESLSKISGGVNAQFSKLNTAQANSSLLSGDMQKYKIHAQIQLQTKNQTGMSDREFAEKSTAGASQAQKAFALDMLINLGFQRRDVLNMTSYSDQNGMTNNLTRDLMMQNLLLLQQVRADLQKELDSESDPKNKKKLGEAIDILETAEQRSSKGNLTPKEKKELADQIDEVLKMKLNTPVLDMLQNQTSREMLHDHNTFAGVVADKRMA